MSLLSACSFNSALVEGEYQQRLDRATAICAELHRGGHTDEEEVRYWLNGARADISESFWSKRGTEFLEAQLSNNPSGVRRACIEQLAREAHARQRE